MQNFQTAMLQDAQTHTMEIKLDLENETFGLQQAKVVPEVSERIPCAAFWNLCRRKTRQKQAAQVQNAEQQAAAAPKTEESDAAEMAFKDISSNGPEPEEEPQAEEGHGHCFRSSCPKQQAPKAENMQAAESAENAGEEAAEPAQQKISVPVTDVTQYRKRDLPVHIINADVLQSAPLSEARVYSDDRERQCGGAHRLKNSLCGKSRTKRLKTRKPPKQRRAHRRLHRPGRRKERGARPAHDDARADNPHACNGREHCSAHFGVAHCGIRLQCQ